MKRLLSLISIAVIAVAAMLLSGCSKADPESTIVANYGVYVCNSYYEDGTATGRMYLYKSESSYNPSTGQMNSEFLRFEFTLSKGADSIFGQKLKIVKTPDKMGTANCFCYNMHDDMGGWIEGGTLTIDENGTVSGKLKYYGKTYAFILEGELRKVEKANG